MSGRPNITSMETPRKRETMERKGSPNPMEEENFPDNPTRRAAEKHMEEPTNTPGSNPQPGKKPDPVDIDDA